MYLFSYLFSVNTLNKCRIMFALIWGHALTCLSKKKKKKKKMLHTKYMEFCDVMTSSTH